MNGDQVLPAEPGDGRDCPVCEWPPRPMDATCRRCGWELRGDYLAGHPTTADYDSIALRLATAQQHWDVRAAVRAVSAAGGNDTNRLAWLCRLARGGEPTAADLLAIQQSVAAAVAAPSSAPGVGYALARLVAGETNRIVLVEISPDGVSVAVLVPSDLGILHRLPAAGSLAWHELLPLLSDDVDLCRFQLAGGIGAAEPGHRPPALAEIGPLRAALSSSMRPAMEKLLGSEAAIVMPGQPAWPRATWPSQDVDTILVRRAAGWAFLEAATDHLRSYLRPVADIAEGPASGPLTVVADRIANLAPIRHAYDLVLAAVDPEDGTVQLKPFTLFPAGTAARPHVKREVKVDVMPSAHASAQLALPVVARVGTDPRNWPLVGGLAISGVVADTTQLRVSLQAPGKLGFETRPAGIQLQGRARGWPTLLRELPRRLPKAQSVDVAFLVELGGDHASVADRVDLVRDLIGALSASAPAGAVQIAVLGYREHHGRHQVGAAEEQESLVVGAGLSPAAAALSLLDRSETWAAVPVYDSHSAPMEHALEFLHKRGHDWRSNARHLLFIVGNRPPHPERVDSRGVRLNVPCPHGHSWPDLLRELRWRHGVEGIAVLDGQQRMHSYAEDAWRQLATQGRFSREKVNVGQLVQAIGLVADSGTARVGLAVRATVPFLAHGIRGGS